MLEKLTAEGGHNVRFNCFEVEDAALLVDRGPECRSALDFMDHVVRRQTIIRRLQPLRMWWPEEYRRAMKEVSRRLALQPPFGESAK